MSVLTLARLMSTAETALSHQAGVKWSRLWLDSMTALFWIMNRGERNQFVRHQKVLKLIEKGDWSHCPGEETQPTLDRGECPHWSLSRASCVGMVQRGY